MPVSLRIPFLCLIIFLSIQIPVFSQEELENWHHQSTDATFPNGIGSDVWYGSGAKPAERKVVVAILDSGIDIEHPDLKPHIWVNPGEIAGNKKDDDNNGYVDDIHGWNFLGGPDGRSVIKESLEVTRLYGKQKAKWENVDASKLKGAQLNEYNEYLKMKEVVESKIEAARQHLDETSQMKTMIMTALEAAKKVVGNDSLRVE